MKDLELCLEEIKEHTAKNNIVGKWSDFLVEKKFSDKAKAKFNEVIEKIKNSKDKDGKEDIAVIRYRDGKITYNELAYEAYIRWFYFYAEDNERVIPFHNYETIENTMSAFKDFLRGNNNNKAVLQNIKKNDGFDILIEFAEYLQDNHFENLLIELKEKFDNNGK
ncbi:hypothetical protein [Campylobacter sp. JMF_08 NE1]|uniref:hypothetical protein n=1 Tax=Campylobacter sp. JMF_08 NE1 TaxID=2983821 RepID=UPI0022E9F818|nr:hypothetical protein [Campylobacter sp. JMF_08 NE1]MDA3048277.1 hypothetical protein [Campylobacter sp. JMF_08 NE1]